MSGMETRIALLRGINVGRARRIGMADLRRAIGGIGYANVRTLLNSGNVVYEAPIGADDAERVEAAITAELGIRSRVTTLSVDLLDRIVAENPFADAENPSRALIAFVADPARLAALDALAGRDWGAESLAVGRLAAFLSCPHGISAGVLALEVDRALRDGVTMRNLATVARLQAMAGAG